jgi:hypothetical protein
MAKIYTGLGEDLTSICRLKWEFLRRNEEYAVDQKAYAADPEGFEAVCVHDIPLEDGETILGWERRTTHLTGKGMNTTSKADLLREKYGIDAGAPLLDPSKEMVVEPGMMCMSFKDLGVVNCSGRLYIRPHEILLKIDLRKPKRQITDGVQMFIDMELDYRSAKSMEKASLVKEIARLETEEGTSEKDEKRLLSHKIRLESFSARDEPILARKLRLDKYDSYLAVWDLKQKGRTFEQVAEELSEGLPLPDQEYHDTVQRRFKRAEVLIKGGYKEL